MKTREEYQEQQRKRFFEKENERLMLMVYRQELQEMLHLAEYGY